MNLVSRIRKRLGIKPPFEEAKRRLDDAIHAGEISDHDLLKDVGPRVDKVLGGTRWLEGPDWIELEMWADELHLKVVNVHDLARLFEAIDRTYEP